MKRFPLYSFAAAALLFAVPALTGTVMAQQPKVSSAAAPPPAPTTATPVNVDRVIRAFTAKETEFRQALNNYAFKRDAIIQTIGMGGQISGEYRRVSYFTFDDSGHRFEKISFFPMPTLTELSVTNEDLDDLGGVQPFALEASKLDQYNFAYVGKEHIDELDLYVFDVAPKIVPKKESERFFKGRIWVDDQSLQIVKVRGKGVPEGKQRFPTFETYREQIDGRYWFPTYTYADEDLVFEGGQVVHFRMRVTYSDFKRGRADVRIIETDDAGPGIEDETGTKPEAKPTATPTTRPNP